MLVILLLYEVMPYFGHFNDSYTYSKGKKLIRVRSGSRPLSYIKISWFLWGGSERAHMVAMENDKFPGHFSLEQVLYSERIHARVVSLKSRI